MGMAKLNVFVSGIDDPCGLDDRTWFVTIYTCDGNVLEYCGKRYVVLPARCGHLEVEVPPGCYYIKAVWGFTVVTPGLVYRANHFTDAAIVTACCEQTVCVKLFNPSVHRCGFIYVRALQDLVLQEAADGAAVERVAGAVERLDGELQEKLGPPPRPFELGHHDEIERLVAERAKAEQG